MPTSFSNLATYDLFTDFSSAYFQQGDVPSVSGIKYIREQFHRLLGHNQEHWPQPGTLTIQKCTVHLETLSSKVRNELLI